MQQENTFLHPPRHFNRKEDRKENMESIISTNRKNIKIVGKKKKNKKKRKQTLFNTLLSS